MSQVNRLSNVQKGLDPFLTHALYASCLRFATQTGKNNKISTTALLLKDAA